MKFNERLLQVAQKDIGLAEIPGAVDHPKIVFAHALMGIRGYDVDATVPWCASFMNVWMLQAAALQNPGKFLSYMQARGKRAQALKIFEFNNQEYHGELDNGVLIPWPSWDAGADSFKEWASPVPAGEEMPGDVCVLKRDGGHHVTLFIKKNKLTLDVLGANQNNQVCVADWYLRSRWIATRRFKAG